VAKIGDVGVARFMHAKDGSNEVAMGTFAYAAPETLLGIDSGVKVKSFAKPYGCFSTLPCTCTTVC
jgi:hypothetical protein